MANNIPTTPPPLEPNPLQRALDTYHELERQHQQMTQELSQVKAENSQLLGEVDLLRSHLKVVESERMRWQAIASTLLGRLTGISDIVAGAVKAAIRDGLEAKQVNDREEDLDRAAQEAAAIIQRAAENGGAKTAPEETASPEPPQAQETAIPKVDFGGGAGMPTTKVEYRR